MDSTDSASVTCGINIEWNNQQSIVTRKISFKSATVRLIRDTTREIFLEITTEKTAPIKLRLRSTQVHKKFMTEGKASIKFTEERCTVYLANAPPGILVAFLKTLFIKMTGNAQQTQADVQKKLRAHFLSEKPSQFEDISPVTNAELMRAKKLALSKSTVTTPSPPQAKKRRSGESTKGPAPKKLYSTTGVASSIVSMDELNEEQNEVLRCCLSGKNVFFTGSAGSGKSFLLRKIISTLPPDGTVATASTGVAACLIGGVTLHSFAGIGSGEASLKRCYELAMRPSSATPWRKCKRLIIDEISMVDGDFFDKIEAVARYVRGNEKPFGGVQLILCGDFLQLPPVTKNASSHRFAFQSAAWERCIQSSFELRQVHRQKDPAFVRVLNSVRIGRVTPEIAERLKATARQRVERNGILATQLCSHTRDSDAINQARLDALEADERVFLATDSDPVVARTLDAQIPAPSRLVLKAGAQVMLLKNVNVAEGLVNGARGIVARFEDGAPVVRFKTGREFAARPEKWTVKTPAGAVLTRRQTPLKLAWAFSIHKSQGLTLDCVEMSLARVFEAGQAYVALSRAQSLDSLRVLDFDARQVWANPDVLKYYQAFRRQLFNVSYVPLGRSRDEADGERTELKRKIAALKKSKSISDKPIVNIC